MIAIGRELDEKQDHTVSALTWLRGIAAALVVVSHSVRALEVSYWPDVEPWVPVWFRAFDLGSFGVAVFFVLSGATLYLSNGARLLKPGSQLPGFYLKRVLRIWPAFAVSWVVYALFRPIFQSFYGEPSSHWVEGQFLAPAGVSEALSYLTLTFNITGPTGLYNNAYWSLPVEFQYYLLFPLLVVLLHRLHWLSLIVLGGVLYGVHRGGFVTMAENLVFPLAFTFIGGVLIGALYKQRGAFLSMFVWRVVAGISCTALLTLCSLMVAGVVPIEVYRVVPSEWVFYGLSALGIVGAVLFSGLRLPGWLQPRLMWVGAVSYSLYLYHNLVIGVVVLVLVNLPSLSGVLRFWAFVPVVFGLSFLLAALSYRWVEQPAIRVGRSLAKRPSVGIA